LDYILNLFICYKDGEGIQKGVFYIIVITRLKPKNNKIFTRHYIKEKDNPNKRSELFGFEFHNNN